MKKYFPVIIGSITFFSIIFWAMRHIGVFNPRIETYITDDNWHDREIRKAYLIWYNGEIVWSKYIKLVLLTDSIDKATFSEASTIKSLIK